MTSSQPIRVMLVDDHTKVCRGLATLLQVFDDLELASEAANGDEAIQQCARLNPDVVLMDLAMPDMDGVTTTRVIRQRFPSVPVLALPVLRKKSWSRMCCRREPSAAYSRM